MCSAFSREIVTSCIPGFIINSLSIWDFLLFCSHFFGINKGCSALAWVHDCLVVHVWLVYPIVSFCAINLSKDVLTHLVEGYLITTFLLPDHGLKLLIHGDISVHELSTEIILGLLASKVSRDHFRHFFLFIELRRHGLSSSCRYSLDITHMTLLVRYTLWFDIWSVRLLIVWLRNFEGLLYFAKLWGPSILLIYIAYEFFGGN